MLYNRNIGICCIFLFYVAVLSCRTQPESKARKHEIAINRILNSSIYTADVYIGISGRMTTRAKEIDYAKLLIAHQIATRDKCIVDTGMISLYGRQQDFIVMDSNFDYDDTYINELTEYIEVINSYVFPDVAVVVARDNRQNAEANILIPRLKDKQPRWVHDPQWVRDLPGMEGCFVGVGSTEDYSSLYKGIRVADVLAAQAIATEKNAFARTFLYDHEDNRTAYTEFGNAVLTKAELYGFYILDRWVEPDGSACYSLGIALKDK